MAVRITDLKSTGASYAELDDKMLVLDFQAGQPAAFVEIHRRYAPLAKHVCRRFLPNPHDADEAFQETMIRVFQGLFRFNGQYALQPWIARISTNVALDQIRTRSRRPQVDGSIEDHDREDPKDGPEEFVERLIERDLVLAVLADLPESHRTALVLRELEGRSHKEIADHLALTPGQAKALIHRAKGSFRRAWLVRMTERDGLAGMLLAPLLWLARGLDGLGKRAFDKAGQVAHAAQVATPEVVSSATASVASPPMASMSERLVAAGMTLLVAGGVTAGAVIVRDHSGRVDTDVQRVAPSPAIADTRIVAAAPRIEPPSREAHDGGDSQEKPPSAKHEHVTLEPVPGPTQAPTPVESPPPSESPPASPSPAESSAPPPAENPGPPPAENAGPPPAPTFGFTSSILGQATELRSLSSKVARAGRDVVFSQTLTGALKDAGDGDARVYLEAWGSANAADGSVTMFGFVDDGDGRYRYDGNGFLSSSTTAEDGSTTYAYIGTYNLTDSPQSDRVMPASGALTITVTVWADAKALVDTEISFAENRA